MKIVEVFLCWLPGRFITLVFLPLLDYLRLVVTVYQIAIYLFVDLVFRWTVSKASVLVPSLSSGVDNALARLKLAPLNTFPHGHYPRLQAIINAVQHHLQNPHFNPQVVDACNRVLSSIHEQRPDFPPENMAVDAIRHHFTVHWPRILPLDKALCLKLAPTKICWGMADYHGINEPILWINPYLVQALEAVQEGSDVHAYLQFLTIVTILHEAMHLIVRLVSPGMLTPGDVGESGFRLEMQILQNTILLAEMRESDVFHLTRVQRLLLRFVDDFESFWILTGEICREAVDRFLIGQALWIAVEPEPHPALLTRINLVSNTLIRLRSSPPE